MKNLKDVIKNLLIATQGVCPITNCQLDLDMKRGYLLPSVDRIDSKKGYVEGNMQVVSLGANLIKGEEATTEEVREFFKQVKESPVLENIVKYAPEVVLENIEEYISSPEQENTQDSKQEHERPRGGLEVNDSNPIKNKPSTVELARISPAAPD